MNRQEFNVKHTKMTRSLKELVVSYEKNLPADVYEKFLGSLDAEIGNAYDALMAAPAGPARARKLHEMVEGELSNNANVVPSCFKGCSACCHLEVEVTNYESEILLELLESGHPIEAARLEKQSLRSVQDPKWREGRRNDENQCVFLGADRACSIYEHRPVMCRRHAVTSAPAACESVDDQITLCYYPRVDVLLVAASEDPDLSIGPLAKMLLQKI